MLESMIDATPAEEAELEAAAARIATPCDRDDSRENVPRGRPPLVRLWFFLGSDEGCGLLVLALMASPIMLAHYPALEPYGPWIIVLFGLTMMTRASWIYEVYPDPFVACTCPHGSWCRLSLNNPITKADVEGTNPNRTKWKPIRTLGGHRAAVLACRGRCKHHKDCRLIRNLTSEAVEPEHIRGRGFIRNGDLWISPDYTEVVYPGRVQRGDFTLGSDGRVYNNPTSRRSRRAA